MKKVFFILLSAFLIVGCAGGPKATPAADAKAKQFILPTDGTANLYIYRNEMFGGGVNMDVFVDDKRAGTTGPKTFIMKNLPAGEYKVEGVAFEGSSILKVNLQPNTYKFIWQEVKMGVLGARNKLKEVDPVTGKSGVLESKLLLD